VRTLRCPRWPNGARAAVSLTFDVDGEAALTAESSAFRTRLSSLSDQRFGIVRGLPRILTLLREAHVAATFYVPGATAERYPDEIGAIIADGHEIGHHGHRHLPPHQTSPQAQQEEVAAGLEAIERVLGVRPRGYRAPGWEVTPETFRHVHAAGFQFDSSFMADDRPYVEEHGGRALLELPVHWTLDDFPLLAFRPTFVGTLSPPDAVRDLWLRELGSAVLDGRHTTFTMHPEVIGRGSRFGVLEALVTVLMDREDLWVARHTDVADLYTAGDGVSS
jgi:peptidoglycan/xylan/chitin deacetylase (PgdA/CDA1 family)